MLNPEDWNGQCFKSTPKQIQSMANESKFVLSRNKWYKLLFKDKAVNIGMKPPPKKKVVKEEAKVPEITKPLEIIEEAKYPEQIVSPDKEKEIEVIPEKQEPNFKLALMEFIGEVEKDYLQCYKQDDHRLSYDDLYNILKNSFYKVDKFEEIFEDRREAVVDVFVRNIKIDSQDLLDWNEFMKDTVRDIECNVLFMLFNKIAGLKFNFAKDGTMYKKMEVKPQQFKDIELDQEETKHSQSLIESLQKKFGSLSIADEIGEVDFDSKQPGNISFTMGAVPKDFSFIAAKCMKQEMAHQRVEQKDLPKIEAELKERFEQDAEEAKDDGQLPSSLIDEDMDADCPVCFCFMAAPAKMPYTPCCHHFCRDCVRAIVWKTLNDPNYLTARCPMCRTEIEFAQG